MTRSSDPSSEGLVLLTISLIYEPLMGVFILNNVPTPTTSLGKPLQRFCCSHTVFLSKYSRCPWFAADQKASFHSV